MSKTKPWQWIALGCGGLVVLTVATGAFFTVLYWPKLTAVYQQAKSSVADMMHVSAAVQRQYGGHVAVIARHQSGVAGTILRITLTNPTFLDKTDADDPGLSDKAREVAAAARDALGQSGYDTYEVQFVREKGTGVTVSRSWDYRFRASELPSAKSER